MSEPESGEELTRVPHDLKGKAQKGFFWSYGAVISGRMMFFVATLVLARLLSPSQFGLVAFTVAILSFLDNLTDLGVGQALVYRSDGTDQDVASTAFWVSVIGSLAAVGIVWTLAPVFAHFGPDERVQKIFLVLCFQFPLRALGSIHRYLAMHALEFKRLTLAEFLSQTVKGALSVGLALNGAGVWSLVIGQLASTFVWSVSLWFVTDWRPSWVIQRKHIRSLVGFGLSIGFIGIVGYASHNTDYIIVGARLGAEQLGFYTLAFRIPEIAILEIFMVFQGILFPYFARLNDSPDDAGDTSALAVAYRQALRISAIIAFPLGFGMAALALPLVLVVYGHEWRPSAVPLALVALWSAFAALGGLPATAFKALGRGGLLTGLAAIEVAITIPSLWFIAPLGIGYVAGALLAVKLAVLTMQAFVVRRVIGVSCLAQLVNAIRGLCAAGLMAAAVYLVARTASPPVALAAGLLVGTIAYLGIMRAFFADDLRFLLQLVPDRVRPRRLGRLIPAAATPDGTDGL